MRCDVIIHTAALPHLEVGEKRIHTTHDHTGSNNHSCVFPHLCPSLYGHGFSRQRSGSPTGFAVLEQTDREESQPDQPIPGGEL